jgi:hypothetical protein
MLQHRYLRGGGGIITDASLSLSLSLDLSRCLGLSFRSLSRTRSPPLLPLLPPLPPLLKALSSSASAAARRLHLRPLAFFHTSRPHPLPSHRPPPLPPPAPLPLQARTGPPTPRQAPRRQPCPRASSADGYWSRDKGARESGKGARGRSRRARERAPAGRGVGCLRDGLAGPCCGRRRSADSPQAPRAVCMCVCHVCVFAWVIG